MGQVRVPNRCGRGTLHKPTIPDQASAKSPTCESWQKSFARLRASSHVLGAFLELETQATPIHSTKSFIVSRCIPYAVLL
ncbi:hypothetical protein VTK26DRAFT_1717 [Humicola hyalothermophila]